MVEKGENVKIQILTSGQLSMAAEPNNFDQMETTKRTKLSMRWVWAGQRKWDYLGKHERH